MTTYTREKAFHLQLKSLSTQSTRNSLKGRSSLKDIASEKIQVKNKSKPFQELD